MLASMVRTILGKPLHTLLELSRQGQGSLGSPNGVGGTNRAKGSFTLVRN